jgi:hypothetical protein
VVVHGGLEIAALGKRRAKEQHGDGENAEHTSVFNRASFEKKHPGPLITGY